PRMRFTHLVDPETGTIGQARRTTQELPKQLKYATGPKERKNGRVVQVTTRVVFGTLAAVRAALALSLVSKVVNTVFVERHNGSDRNRNRRKVRKTWCFSKDYSSPGRSHRHDSWQGAISRCKPES